jgi:hypothetical protein
MSIAKGTWREMGVELIHKGGEDIKECVRGVQRGELPMYINSIHFPKFVIGI